MEARYGTATKILSGRNTDFLRNPGKELFAYFLKNGTEKFQTYLKLFVSYRETYLGTI